MKWLVLCLASQLFNFMFRLSRQGKLLSSISATSLTRNVSGHAKRQRKPKLADKMKGFFTVLTLLTFTTIFAVTPCDKCDIEKVKIANEHLDSLTFQIVSDLLCTFDSICNNNVEYSEWSNETLFKVLEKSPTIFFEVVANEQVNSKLLLREIESPIHDFELQKIYDKIRATSAPTNIKAKYLNALIIAAQKDGQKIKE